jgi:hypothetical protein
MIMRLLTAAFSLLLISCQTLSVVIAEPFPAPTRPKPSEFLLMAWDDVRPELERIKELGEAGLNAAGFCSEADLTEVRAAGLTCVFKDPKVSHYDWLGNPPTKVVV